MPRFYLEDIKHLEKSPSSPANLRCRVSELLINSVRANAKVEVVNRETGEYRVVLQGTLDKEQSKWWW
ncbi:MAG: hypothetical protein AB1756_03910 [Acidobacteriota bacterium]